MEDINTMTATLVLLVFLAERVREREMAACHVGFVTAWQRNNHASTTVRVVQTVLHRNDASILLVRPYIARGSVLSWQSIHSKRKLHRNADA